VTGGGSALIRYMDVVVGKRSYRYLLYFEFCAWIGRVPGALGLFLSGVSGPVCSAHAAAEEHSAKGSSSAILGESISARRWSEQRMHSRRETMKWTVSSL
jgi:hypothetical protein